MRNSNSPRPTAVSVPVSNYNVVRRWISSLISVKSTRENFSVLSDEHKVSVERENAWHRRRQRKIPIRYFSEAGSRESKCMPKWQTIKVADHQNACRTLFTWWRQRVSTLQHHETQLQLHLSHGLRNLLSILLEWLIKGIRNESSMSSHFLSPCFFLCCCRRQAVLMSLLSLWILGIFTENSRFHLTTSTIDDVCVLFPVDQLV